MQPHLEEPFVGEQEMQMALSNAPVVHSAVSSSRTPKVYPSIRGYTVQCSNCYKWRLIPSKERYETIRANILDIPFLCEMAREWQRDVSCEHPSDVNQDGSRLWAFDKPNIPLPPSGWKRELRFRAVGGSKFADVYYYSPFKRRFRSISEIEKYLQQHPEHLAEGISLNQFSFDKPKPFFSKSVKRNCPPCTTSSSHDERPPRPSGSYEDEDTELQGETSSAHIAGSNS